MTTENTPWLDRKGNNLTTSQLKELSKTWDVETWEDYLQEEVETGRKESLLHNPWKLDEFETSYSELLQAEKGSKQIDKFKKLLGNCLAMLTAKEQRIIYLIFWKGYSQREIAALDKVSRSAIERTRNRALRKLGDEVVRSAIAAKTQIN